MKTKKINVADVKDVEVHIPETLHELRAFVSDEADIMYLANRGLDQVRRTCLLSRRRNGTSKGEIHRLAEEYHYHRGSREQLLDVERRERLEQLFND